MNNLKNLEEAFFKHENIKINDNGDIAFKNLDNFYTDILFKTAYYRNHLDELYEKTSTWLYDVDEDEAKNLIYFALAIRTPRLIGVGERDIALTILSAIYNAKNIILSPDVVAHFGRYKDLLDIKFHSDIKTNNDLKQGYYEYIFNKAKEGDTLAKKWLPRYSSGKVSKMRAKYFIKQFCNGDFIKYKNICKVDTTEDKITKGDFDKIDYSKVPSLCMVRNSLLFKRKDNERFTSFLDKLDKGETKVNNSVSNPIDLYKLYERSSHSEDNMICTLYKQLEKTIGSFGSILPVIDTSYSMTGYGDESVCALDVALSLGHYVSRNNTYIKNGSIVFSSNPHLILLDDEMTSYNRDMNNLKTGDCSNTNLIAVMDVLSKLESGFPDYVLIISDMEFDCGSYYSKETVLDDWDKRNIDTKIIWWNVNGYNQTVPELDTRGNIYMSGYNPRLLDFIKEKFDMKNIIANMIEIVKVELQDKFGSSDIH